MPRNLRAESQPPPSIRWGRVILAAILSEFAVFAVLLSVIYSHQYLFAPGRTADEYSAFNETASYYLAPISAGIAAFALAFWAARRAPAPVTTGMMVGILAVILSISFIFLAKPEDRLMYGVSYLLRLAGGYSGGVLAQRMSNLQVSKGIAQ